MPSPYLTLCTRVSRMDFVELFRDCGARPLKFCANASKLFGSVASYVVRETGAIEWVRFRLVVRSTPPKSLDWCCWCVNTKFGKLGSAVRFGLFGAAIFVISGNLRCRSCDELFRVIDGRERIFSMRGSCSTLSNTGILSILRSRSSISMASMSRSYVLDDSRRTDILSPASDKRSRLRFMFRSL